jgi:hypothetical protein
MLVDVLDLVPGASAVGRLIDATVGTRSEQRATGGDVGFLPISRRHVVAPPATTSHA